MTDQRDHWLAQLKSDASFAETVLTTSGDLRTMFVIHCKDARRLIATSWADDDEKRTILGLVTVYCVAYDAHALTSMSEAWMVTQTGRSPAEAIRRSGRLSEHPNREEVVVVCTQWRDAGRVRTLSALYPIERNAAGKVIGLGLDKARDTDETGGMFLRVFPPKAANAQLQQEARDLLAKMPPDFKQVAVKVVPN